MKYALIGCGRIATNHVKAVLNNELEFVAACDLLPEAIEALLAKHDLEKDDSESSEEEAAFVQALITSGALIDEDESVGIWRKEVSPSADKKISSSICMNDIRNMNKLALKGINNDKYKGT